MKVSAVLILAAIVAYASASALPEMIYDGPIYGEDGDMINLEDVDTDGGLSSSAELPPIRHRRITCDVFSFSTPWGSANHSICAVKCLAQGRRGGTCRDGVCHCR